MYSVRMNDLVKNLNVEIVYVPESIDRIHISGIEINRPGLQLTGFYRQFFPGRIQVVGDQEIEYLNSLEKEKREKSIENLFKYPIPVFIVAHDIEVFPEMLEYSKKYKRPLLKTKHPTSRFITKVIGYLEVLLAPKTTIHGALLEVFGMGVLIKGNSGVGKSETALELIKRGHRLVADDTVEIKQIEETLRGTSPDLIRHYMEIRGIGILDVKRLYGFGAVKNWELVDLVVELEDWDREKEYDRLGLDEEVLDILGVKVPKITVPVKPGRNIAMIIEVAVRNTRQKQFGHNAAIELNKKIQEKMEKRRKEREEY